MSKQQSTLYFIGIYVKELLENFRCLLYNVLHRVRRKILVFVIDSASYADKAIAISNRARI